MTFIVSWILWGVLTGGMSANGLEGLKTVKIGPFIPADPTGAGMPQRAAADARQRETRSTVGKR